jgi:formylglycine-generating enzyme required for sulfatase activity
MMAVGYVGETAVEWVPAFRIGKYETTIARYRECVQTGACQAPYFDSVDLAVRGAFWDPAFDLFPMDGARSSDAVAFCDWDGGRLPTRAEWTKAARGGCDLHGSPVTCDDPEDLVRYPWGDDEPSCDRANFSPDFESGVYCAGRSERVGSFPNGQSIHGAHDMIGNVSELMAAPCFFVEPVEFCFNESRWSSSARNAIDSVSPAGNAGFRCAYAP